MILFRSSCVFWFHLTKFVRWECTYHVPTFNPSCCKIYVSCQLYIWIRNLSRYYSKEVLMKLYPDYLISNLDNFHMYLYNLYLNYLNYDLDQLFHFIILFLSLYCTFCYKEIKVTFCFLVPIIPVCQPLSNPQNSTCDNTKLTKLSYSRVLIGTNMIVVVVLTYKTAYGIHLRM